MTPELRRSITAQFATLVLLWVAVMAIILMLRFW